MTKLTRREARYIIINELYRLGAKKFACALAADRILDAIGFEETTTPMTDEQAAITAAFEEQRIHVKKIDDDFDGTQSPILIRWTSDLTCVNCGGPFEDERLTNFDCCGSEHLPSPNGDEFICPSCGAEHVASSHIDLILVEHRAKPKRNITP